MNTTEQKKKKWIVDGEWNREKQRYEFVAVTPSNKQYLAFYSEDLELVSVLELLEKFINVDPKIYKR